MWFEKCKDDPNLGVVGFKDSERDLINKVLLASLFKTATSSDKFEIDDPLLSLCRILLPPENHGVRRLKVLGRHLQALASAVEATRTEADDTDVKRASNLVTELNVAAIALNTFPEGGLSDEEIDRVMSNVDVPDAPDRL
ncbi:MAG: hypothetical protein QG628_283 [Patescibacteria group bacterium]|jgi:hypothetical protein|nr:hypothetical protein [Patescibacteria group bacterium]